MTDKQKRIPIAAAKRIAEEYNFDQVVIFARKVESSPGLGDGGEHVTTKNGEPRQRGPEQCVCAAPKAWLLTEITRQERALDAVRGLKRGWVTRGVPGGGERVVEAVDGSELDAALALAGEAE